MQERTSDLIYKPRESDCYEPEVSWLSKTPVIFKNSDDGELNIWFSVIRYLIFTFPDHDVFNHEGRMTGSVLLPSNRTVESSKHCMREIILSQGLWDQLGHKTKDMVWRTRRQQRSENRVNSSLNCGQVKALISVSTRDRWRRLALSNNLTLSHQCLVTSGSMKPTWQKPKLMVTSQKGNFQCDVYSMQHESRVKISILVWSKLLLTNLLCRQLAFTSF